MAAWRKSGRQRVTMMTEVLTAEARLSQATILLNPAAMAARSPAVLWSFAHEFHGDIARGVAELQG